MIIAFLIWAIAATVVALYLYDLYKRSKKEIAPSLALKDAEIEAAENSFKFWKAKFESAKKELDLKTVVLQTVEAKYTELFNQERQIAMEKDEYESMKALYQDLLKDRDYYLNKYKTDLEDEESFIYWQNKAECLKNQVKHLEVESKTRMKQLASALMLVKERNKQLAHAESWKARYKNKIKQLKGQLDWCNENKV